MFIKGNFLFTPSRHELTIRENQYAHIENGVVTGFMTDLPETTGPETVVDYNQESSFRPSSTCISTPRNT